VFVTSALDGLHILKIRTRAIRAASSSAREVVMFDFDVVTGPTQPPHCPPADEPAGPAASESAPHPAGLTAAAAAWSTPNPEMEGESRS
jgi:hypothetical protein